jgi:hypothetical protein
MKGEKIKMVNDTVFYVGGSKGGVGKSLISMSLIDYLISRYAGSKKTVLIETDDSNPDVAAVYGVEPNNIPTETIVLDERENGWINLFMEIEKKYKDSLIVINSAARSNTGLKMHGRNFATTLEQMNIDLVTLWPMNRQADSVNLLLEYLKEVDYGMTFPILNMYFGTPSEFVIFEDIYSSGKESTYFQERCPRDSILNFPALNDLIAFNMYSKRYKVQNVADNLQIFQRQLFRTWREKVYKLFDDAKMIEEVEEE